MVNIISVWHQELGYLNVPENTLIEIDQLKNYPQEKTVLITTGSQGESMAALSRMAADMHQKVSIMPGDTVIFSSNPIPGNEKVGFRVLSTSCLKKVPNVIFQDAHVSGHACQEETEADLFSGKTEICNSGSWRIPSSESAGRYCQSRLGIPKENIFILQSGDVLELDDE